MTSSIVVGSSPAFTPITIASRRDGDRGRREQVVDDLHGLAEARLFADVEELAEHLDHRAQLVGERARAGDHHRERALLGAGRPAAYRRIDRRDAFRREPGGDLLGDARAGGREIDERLDLACPRSRRPCRARPLLTTSGVGRLTSTVSHCEATSAAEAARLAPRCSSRCIAVSLVSNTVTRVARFEQAAGHVNAHAADADEAELFVGHLSSALFCCATDSREMPRQKGHG